MRSIPVLALIVTAMVAAMMTATPLLAQFDEPMRQHDAHVHGEATGSLSVDARTLTLSMQMPAYNLIGFEHAPNDANQQAVIDRTLEDLQSLAWLNVDDEAGCSPSRVAIGTPGLDGDHQHADHHDHHRDNHHDHESHHKEEDHGGHEQGHHDHHHDSDSHDHSDHHAEGHHDHDHNHDHDHDHDHGGHAAFDVQVELDCGQISALRWLDIDLFADYPNNELIRLDVLTETQAMQVDLGPDRNRIDLAP